jgi:hypothetical protein
MIFSITALGGSHVQATGFVGGSDLLLKSNEN